MLPYDTPKVISDVLKIVWIFYYKIQKSSEAKHREQEIAVKYFYDILCWRVNNSHKILVFF